MKKLVAAVLAVSVLTLSGCISAPVTSKEYKNYHPYMKVSNYDRIIVGDNISLNVEKTEQVGVHKVNTQKLKEEIVDLLSSKGINVVNNSSEKFTFRVNKLLPAGTAEHQFQGGQLAASTGSIGLGMLGGAAMAAFSSTELWHVDFSILDANGVEIRRITNSRTFGGMDYEDAIETIDGYYGPKVAAEFFEKRS